ncbi:MAG: DUF72 domain-containing protein [Anaerolineae bacterium]
MNRLLEVVTLAEIFLGTQSLGSRSWIGRFYPPNLKPNAFLQFYSQVFNAVEINATFYGIPRASTVDTWARVTPDDFVFTAKMPKEITHGHRLTNSLRALYEFLGVMSHLGDKLGPILIQLPPTVHSGYRKPLEEFLAGLPPDQKFALEFRDDSWIREDTFQLLRHHRIAWCIADVDLMPAVPEITTDFIYIRWIGHRSVRARRQEGKANRTGDLKLWANTIRELIGEVGRIYGYFNDDYSGHSPSDVNHLKELLSIGKVEPSSLWPPQLRMA